MSDTIGPSGIDGIGHRADADIIHRADADAIDLSVADTISTHFKGVAVLQTPLIELMLIPSARLVMSRFVTSPLYYNLILVGLQTVKNSIYSKNIRPVYN